MNNMIRLIYSSSLKNVYNTLKPNAKSCFQKTYRSFHNNSNLRTKMFMEIENKYAYNIMEEKGYALGLNRDQGNTKSVSENELHMILNDNLSRKKPQELFELFPILGTYCCEHQLCISNKIFDDYIDHLTDNFKLASDEELKTLFYTLEQWPETQSVRTRNFIEIWAALDDECLSRHKRWSHDDLLNFVSLFFMLNVSRASDFCVKALNKLATRAKKLTLPHLVQTLFFVGVMRKAPIDMHNLEIHLYNNFSSFTVDELAIMSMGFFKSRTPMRNRELVSKVIDVVTENAQNIHEVSLAALLKVIRLSMKICIDGRIYRMLDALLKEVPRLSDMCKVHIALVGTATLTLHEPCLDKIADVFSQSMSNARVKDLERLVLTLGIFNYNPKSPGFFQKVIDELTNPKRNDEINKHGRSFACCVSYLGLVGLYPKTLINRILKAEFLDNIYGKYVFGYGREILTLSNIAEIFCKDTVKPLTEKQLSILAKKYTDYVPNENYKSQFNANERFMLDVMKLLRTMYGSQDYVTADHILTHYQRGDVILCQDESGTPMPVVDAFPNKTFGSVRKPPDSNKWKVLVIAGRNTIIQGRNLVTGPYNAKCRELKVLGYYPALVQWNVWSTLESDSEKTEYLKDLIT